MAGKPEGVGLALAGLRQASAAAWGPEGQSLMV